MDDERDGEGAVAGGGDRQEKVDVVSASQAWKRGKLEWRGVSGFAAGRDVGISRVGLGDNSRGTGTGEGGRDAGHGRARFVSDDDADVIALVGRNNVIAIAGRN